MLGYVRVIVGPEGKMLGYEPASLYYPTPQTLDFLKEVFGQGYYFDLSDTFAHDSEAIVTFGIRATQSNNHLDPIDYDFELVVHNITSLRNGYKESRRQEIEEYRLLHRKCRQAEKTAEQVEAMVGEWESLYEEDFYPSPLPASYIKDSLETHDPFDLYLHGH